MSERGGFRLSQVPEQTQDTVDFVHLHMHTHYSLLDGLQKVPQLVDKIEAMGQKAVAITDHGSLSGAIEFYKECTKRDIKPIIGIETYVAPRKYTDKTSAEDRNPYHLILLAKNNAGYKNLMKLSTIANLDGFYYKPRIDHDLLEQHSEGLICLSACIGGEVGSAILNDNIDQARSIVDWYISVFGREDYFLEIQPHVGWAPQEKVNKALAKIAKEKGIGLVATGDSHYTNEADHYPHEILLCVQTGSNIDDPKRFKLDQDLSVHTGEHMLKCLPDYPEAISNTVKIAERCNVEIKLGDILIPKFDTPDGQSEQAYLRQLVFAGAALRYCGVPHEDISLMTEEKVKQKLDKKILDRIEYELSVIAKMGYDGYFLIVADMINWAKNQGIVCGPGRGSAAGSIIAYVTNITDLDPIKYDLLFERFLNPDRISMPDIDMDYADDRREEVIEYVTEKYGQERVAQIITFGVMAARNAVRDTGRVLGFPYGEVDALAKLIPAPVQGRHIPLRDSAGLSDPAKGNQELMAEYQNNPRARQIIDVAVQLEGTIRNAGTHAAGVVISKDPIVEHAPLTRASKGGVATQYSMTPIEELGLLKFDFLGLSNLTVIKNALRIIKKVYHRDIDIGQIPLDDKKTFELLAKGDTTGVFQLESAGMKRYLRELKPSQFEDIIAMVALYRPGPMQWIDDFIRRKHNPELVTFGHPKMEAALQNTYGIIVYQEQVMQIAKDLCGFTGGQADTLRKAIGKKQVETMAKMKKDFIAGAVKHSDADPVFVEGLWKSLEDFAAYCFNKSHAACYGLIAVWTAYLKAHYPSAFMAALMTSDYGDLDRIAIEVGECRHMGIELLAPDINESYAEFAVVPETGNIRFGLSAIKNVGMGPIEAILSAREDKPFSSIEDFVRRVNATAINRKTLESLIKAGAFDSMGDRDLLLFNINKMTAYAARAQKHALSGQIDIFGSLGVAEEEPPLHLDTPVEKTDAREKLTWERELLGLYISSHPLDEYEAYFADKTEPISSLNAQWEAKSVKVGGILTTVRKIVTKNGANMAFVGLESKHGETELIVFPKAYEKVNRYLVPDQVVIVQGKVSTKDRDGKQSNEVKIMLDKLVPIEIEKARNYKPKPKPVPTPVEVKAKDDELIIFLPAAVNPNRLVTIKRFLESIPGQQSVYLTIGDDRAKTIRLPFRISLNQAAIDSMAEELGDVEYEVRPAVRTHQAQSAS